jgi:hypothetical protein
VTLLGWFEDVGELDVIERRGEKMIGNVEPPFGFFFDGLFDCSI